MIKHNELAAGRALICFDKGSLSSVENQNLAFFFLFVCTSQPFQLETLIEAFKGWRFAGRFCKLRHLSLVQMAEGST